MDPLPGHLQTPLPRLLAQVSKVMELPAFEEALPGIRHLTLDLWLIFGMACSRRVGDEAAVLGILQKASGQSWIKRVSTHYSSREIVQHQVFRDAAKEGPCRL